MNRPVVMHVVDTYLFKTGSWIHNLLIRHHHFEPHALGTKTENLEAFPLAHVHTYDRLGFLEKAFIRLKNSGGFNDVYWNFCSDRLKTSRAKLIHCHFGNIGYDNLVLKEQSGLPLICTFYGVDVNLALQDSSWEKKYHTLFKKADLILAEGEFMRESLIKMGCPPEKVTVQRIGVMHSRFKFTIRKPGDDGTTIFLMAASFREKKGFPYALQAFAKIKDAFPKARLHIIGDGPQKALLHQIVEDHHMQDQVKFLGFVPYAELYTHMYNSHIFLSPSITAEDGDTEGGSPVAITEALATGMPILATHHADIPAVVSHEHSGYLAPEKDIDTLADYMNRLLVEPDRWESFGRFGRAHIEKEFDLDLQAKKLEAHYQKLCGDSL